MSATLQMNVSLHVYYSSQVNPTYQHTLLKSNKLQLLFTIILQYMKGDAINRTDILI